MDRRIHGVSVEQPVVFELTKVGKSVGQEVQLRVPGMPGTNPEVRVEPATTLNGFRFEASHPHWREHADDPGHSHLHVEVTCSGGSDGAEDRARLLITFPGGDTVPVELIASVNHTAPFSQILREEYRELRPEWAPQLDAVACPPEPPPHDEGQQGDPVLRRAEDAALRQLYDVAHAAPEGLAALCFSGGGIRSATFNLGILQALAGLGLLDKFHYLSTVSGGGYIGSWLSGWIHREGHDKVLADLAGTKPTPTRPRAGADPPPAPVQQLPEPAARLLLRRHLDPGRHRAAQPAPQLAWSSCRSSPPCWPCRCSPSPRSPATAGRAPAGRATCCSAWPSGSG